MLQFSVPHFTSEDLAVAKDCFERGQIDPADKAREFERAIAHHLGVSESWVLCTGSGTAALEVAARLRPWQTVAASLLTWPGTYSYLPAETLISSIGLGPEADGRPDYLREGAEDLQIFVQLWGARQIPDGFPSQCRAQHIVVDAAHNLFDPKHSGLLRQGVTVCYSFGPLKQITTGRGGAVLSRDLENLETRLMAEAYIHYGVYGRYQQRPGRNLQITEPAAAIGLSQLKRWGPMQIHRRSILASYEKNLGGRLVTLPFTHSGHLAVCRIPPGTYPDVKEAMADRGIAVGRHYALSSWPVCPEVCTIPCQLKMEVSAATDVARNLQEALREIETD